MGMMVSLGIIFTLFSSILCDKHDMLSTQVVSWISNQNFTRIIELAFPFSKCCNIYLIESVQDVEEIFNQFRKVYPYEYVLKSPTYECAGYFLLGRTDEEITQVVNKVPSLISNIEILIILNGNVQSNSSIFDTSLYGNANVNIISMSGMWSLTENYLAPRVFQKHHRFEEMVHDYDHINLQGRELQVCTTYRPPFTYLNQTKTKIINGAQAEVFLPDNASEKDGIEWQLFLIIAEKLNFTWTIRKPEGPYRYGRRKGNKWEGGMIQMLNDKKIDLAFGSIWITEDHNAFVNLSEPWYQLFIHFLVPRPKPTTSFWALTRPFSKTIWFLLVSAVLLNSLYTYARAWSDENIPRRFRNFVITLTVLIGCLLGTLSPKKFTTLKLQMLLWQTAGWLIIAAYCSSLAARLASSEYEDRIDTIQQFLEANLSWGRGGQEPPFHEYFDLTDPYSKQLPSKYHHLDNDQQVHQFVMQGNYAIIGKIVDSCFFPENNISNQDIKGYRLMRESVGRYYSTFAVQPWLVKPVNRVMLWLRESGISIFHLRDVIRRRDNFNLREVLVEHDGNDGTPRVLSLTPLAAGFSLLVVGLSISTYVFYLELKYASRSESIWEVLRNVERKRKLRDIAARNRRRYRGIKFLNYKEDLSSIQFETHPPRRTL